MKYGTSIHGISYLVLDLLTPALCIRATACASLAQKNLAESTQLNASSDAKQFDLPLMSNRASLATLEVRTKVVPAAWFTDANLFYLAICRAVILSLEHGNSDGSCVAYVWLGMTAGPNFGNYQAGFRFDRLGYELVEKRGLKRFQARTYMLFGSHVMPWTKHVWAGRDLLQRTFEAANNIGDLTFAAYSCNNLNTNCSGNQVPASDQG